MAILEKGVGALAFASGQAANTAAILTICKAGDHIVAVSTLYGGTITLLASTLKNYGIETTFVNPEASEEEFKAAFRENTKNIIWRNIRKSWNEYFKFWKNC